MVKISYANKDGLVTATIRVGLCLKGHNDRLERACRHVAGPFLLPLLSTKTYAKWKK